MTTPVPPETRSDDLDERRLQVLAAQVSGVRWQVALTTLVIAALAWNKAPAALVVAWVAAVIASREWRSALLVRLSADRAAPMSARLRKTVQLNLLIGACYGASALFMAWLDTTLDAVLTMILVSLAAGGVSVSSTVIRAYVAYAAPMFVPIAAMWALEGSWLGGAIASLVLLFFGVQMRFARDNLETFEQSFRIRLENQELARNLAAERSELERTRDAAVQANREKSRFLAAASHDLRQPLQALTLNSGELSRLPLTGDAREIASDIGTSVEQLRSMLDALLDLSKLDAGGVVAAARRVRMLLTVQAVVASFRAAALARGVELQYACPAELAVHTDPDLLGRMLSNLVDNAIKFAPGGQVGVEVTARGPEVEVAVRDSGPGIAEEHHRLIFEDLVQLPGNGRERPPGHGLGLGIVRRAAALLGVQVEVDSAPGRGAVFRWRLPRADMQAADVEASEAVPRLRGRHVLILDDDAMVRGAYAHALMGVGATTAVAATPDEARLAVRNADAAVVDWRLADGGDGFAAIDALRRVRPGIAVVMVTADTGAAIAEAACAQGVTLLRKPVDAGTLARALDGALQAARAAADAGVIAGAAPARGQ